MLREARAYFYPLMEGFGLFAGERDAPDALALPRAAPNKLTTDLTLSSAERSSLCGTTGAPAMGRERRN